MADELNLNSISRYRKQSPTLVLEEFGHCEVPAGCGGVVLRWTDSRLGLSMSIQTFVYHGPDDAEKTRRRRSRFLLDAQPVRTSRPFVPFGEHVFAIEVMDVAPEGIAMMFAAATDGHFTHGSRLAGPEATLACRVLTAADGSWLCTYQEPPDESWMRPGFAATGWLPMTETTLDEETLKKNNYALKRPSELGAVLLKSHTPRSGPEGPSLWIRKSFSFPAEVAP
jgi:hypothetical protein